MSSHDNDTVQQHSRAPSAQYYNEKKGAEETIQSVPDSEEGEKREAREQRELDEEKGAGEIKWNPGFVSRFPCVELFDILFTPSLG